jgi:hypothetical protein
MYSMPGIQIQPLSPDRRTCRLWCESISATVALAVTFGGTRAEGASDFRLRRFLGVDRIFGGMHLCQWGASLVLRPFPKGHDQVEVVAVRQVRYIGLTAGAVVAERFQFLLILVRAHDHDVRSYVKLVLL